MCDHSPPDRPNTWMWIFLIISVLALTHCVVEDSKYRGTMDSSDRIWSGCISTVARNQLNTVSPEQIAACAKAAGKTGAEEPVTNPTLPDL